MVKTYKNTRLYIREIPNFSGFRPARSQDIDFCNNEDKKDAVTCVCVYIVGGGAICTGVGAGVHIAGLLWTGASLLGTAALWFPIVRIVNKTKEKIYYIKDVEYRKFQDKTKEIAKKPYNYSALFESIERGSLNKKKETYDEAEKIFKDSNSNSDFQKKREKIQEDYEILRWKITWKNIGVSNRRYLSSELDSLNRVITKLAEKKWLIGKKLLNFLLINKSAGNGSILDGIFQTEANCFPEDLNIKIICAATSDSKKSSNKQEFSEKEIADTMKIISENKINALAKIGKKNNSRPPIMCMK